VKSIYIAHPTMKERSGWVNPYLAHYLSAVTRNEQRFNLCFPSWPTVDFSPHDVARNRLAIDFLESRADYWLTVDNDTIPVYLGEWVDLLGMAACGRDIIGAPCPIFGDWCFFNVYKRVEPSPAGARYRTLKQDEVFADVGRDLLKSVDSIGFGAMVIHRRVVTRLVAEDGYFCRFRLNPATQERDLGEDHDFCERAKARGFEIVASYAHICGHFKNVDVLQCLLTEKDMRQAAPRADARGRAFLEDLKTRQSPEPQPGQAPTPA
jgi:hypothetical protein